MGALERVLEATYQKLLSEGKKLILEQVTLLFHSLVHLEFTCDNAISFQIITTIASVADASQELFVTFYDRLIGPLKFILRECPENFKVFILIFSGFFIV